MSHDSSVPVNLIRILLSTVVAEVLGHPLGAQTELLLSVSQLVHAIADARPDPAQTLCVCGIGLISKRSMKIIK